MLDVKVDSVIDGLVEESRFCCLGVRDFEVSEVVEVEVEVEDEREVMELVVSEFE